MLAFYFYSAARLLNWYSNVKSGNLDQEHVSTYFYMN